MEENWRHEKKFDENKLMLRQAGFGVIVVILFLQYFKLAAYISNKFFFDNYFMSYLVLFLGIPLCYFATKFLLRIINSALQS